MRKRLLVFPVLLLLLLLCGCGGPKADVSIFILPSNGMTQEMADTLQKNLQAQLGKSPTVNVQTSPLFTEEKLTVEVAAGDHDIVILPKDVWLGLAQQSGDMVSLDDLLKPADYPDGVVELPVGTDRHNEKHLYAVPVAKTGWMTAAGYKGEELYAFIHPRAPHMDQAKQVLRTIAAK